MSISSKRQNQTGPTLRSGFSSSSSGRFNDHQAPSPYTSFASSTTSFSSRTSSAGGFFHRSTSPTRYGSTTSSSVRFSLDRSTSPGRSLSAAAPRAVMIKPRPHNTTKRTCMCSPTTHPGSFRCSLHKNNNNSNSGSNSHSAPPNRLNARRSAMTNSLVRIGGVEGELVKRALAALIRPSSHQQRRRNGFQPRPSRLSVMSRAEDL